MSSNSWQCGTCRSSLPPSPCDPPPPEGSTLALFFLILGVVMVMTIDPTGALIAPEVAARGAQREIMSSLGIGSGLLSFGGMLLFVAYRRAGKPPIRWVCQRCGSLVDI